MSQFKSAVEMERIRYEDAKLRLLQQKEYRPEPIEYTPWADFRIYRATKGNIKGLFKAVQIISEGDGKKARYFEKTLAEGVDMHVAQCAIRAAVQARLNAIPKR